LFADHIKEVEYTACYLVPDNVNITYWTCNLRALLIIIQFIFRNLPHVYNFITINTGHYFKLLTCSLDRSPFVGETCLICFVVEIHSCTQARFTTFWY